MGEVERGGICQGQEGASSTLRSRQGSTPGLLPLASRALSRVASGTRM